MRGLAGLLGVGEAASAEAVHDGQHRRVRDRAAVIRVHQLLEAEASRGAKGARQILRPACTVPGHIVASNRYPAVLSP